MNSTAGLLGRTHINRGGGDGNYCVSMLCSHTILSRLYSDSFTVSMLISYLCLKFEFGSV